MWASIKDAKKVEKLVTIASDTSDNPPFMSHPIEPNFIEAMFHADYMDVATAFNNLSPNQRQIFNINNVPCEVTKDTDIAVVGEIVNDFIKSVNDNIQTSVPLIHTVNSGWDETLPEHTGLSGWEKVQKQLGLPTTLYNKPKMNTNVKLICFNNIVKYETENETKYVCKIVIQKNKVKDKLVIKVSFVLPKGLKNTNVIIETISILGYTTTQGLGTDRTSTDDFYYFDSLEQNNMLTGKTVARELMKKYDVKKKIMQERIDGMDLDTQEKYHDTPSPSSYDSYRATQTVFDDMFEKKKFD